MLTQDFDQEIQMIGSERRRSATSVCLQEPRDQQGNEPMVLQATIHGVAWMYMEMGAACVRTLENDHRLLAR